MIESIKNGYRYFGAGGILGFDTVAALTVIELKSVYPDIKLILVLLCKNQTRDWKEADIQKYEWIKSEADKVVYTSEHYFNGCMLRFFSRKTRRFMMFFVILLHYDSSVANGQLKGFNYIGRGCAYRYGVIAVMHIVVHFFIIVEKRFIRDFDCQG